MKKTRILIPVLLAVVMIVSALSIVGAGGVDNSGRRTIRVATYNLRSLQDVDFDPSVIAEDIVSHGVEIAGLQELDYYTDRYDGDMVKDIAEAAGFEYYKFVKSYETDNGLYGIGIISKHPIEEFDAVVLPVFGQEDRRLTHSVINVDGTKIDFFNTHFTVNGRDIHQAQLGIINQFTSKCKYFFVTADYNNDDFEDFAIVENSHIINNAETRMKSCEGWSIDNIIFSDTFTVEDYGIYDEVTHSDHKMIWAEFTFDPDEK